MTSNIRTAIIAWTNNPIADDSWDRSVSIPDTCKTDAEVLGFLNVPDAAVFLYEGPDYEGKVVEVLHEGLKCDFPSRYLDLRGIKTLEDVKSQGLITIREMLFCPLEKARQLQEAVEVEDNDDWMDDWRREIAMEAGMLHGVDAYNEAMGY